MTRTGGCLCGAVRYTAEGEPEHHALCHCDDCRRWSGAPFSACMAFQEDRVSVVGTPTDYRSSANVMRSFCGTCGTALFYRNPVVLPGIVDIQSATLDDPAADPPGIEIMVKQRLAWLDDVPALPKFETYPGAD